MKESVTDITLASIGALKGLAEEAKREITPERLEKFGLICGIGAVILAGIAINRTLTPVE